MEINVAVEDIVDKLAQQARLSQRVLAGLSDARKAAALQLMAAYLRAAQTEILAANAEDMANAVGLGLTPALLDRLHLDENRLTNMIDAVEQVAELPDPVGEVISNAKRPNGLCLSRVRVPVGVIGIIYESRPNVTADAAALCLRSGNAVILRGGSEALLTNRAIHRAISAALRGAGIPETAIQLAPTQDRALVGAMLAASGMIDLIIPRGGKSLVARVQNNAQVPILAHLEGICHTFIHESADHAMARDLSVNAKMRSTGICGSMETLLIDSNFEGSAAVIEALIDAGCELRGDDRARLLNPLILPASKEDWDTEYLDAILSVAVVDGLDSAIEHISLHSSHHTDTIITSDIEAGERFLREVDSAIVMVNASSQFADGAEFGLGAEIGIATGRLHARGPVGLEGLTTYKWLVRGTGQLRP